MHILLLQDGKVCLREANVAALMKAVDTAGQTNRIFFFDGDGTNFQWSLGDTFRLGTSSKGKRGVFTCRKVPYPAKS